MSTIEARNIPVIKLLEDYDLTLGTSKVFAYQIADNCVWNLQIICKDLTGTLDGTITMKNSNQNTNETYYNNYAGLSAITLDDANKSASMEDFMCTSEYLVVDFQKNGITGGTISLYLKIKST